VICGNLDEQIIMKQTIKLHKSSSPHFRHEISKIRTRSYLAEGLRANHRTINVDLSFSYGLMNRKICACVGGEELGREN
jgi:hypothetical protein